MIGKNDCAGSQRIKGPASCVYKRRPQIHRDWMVHAYVVTFAFATFQLLNDYYPGARLVTVAGHPLCFGCFSLKSI